MKSKTLIALIAAAIVGVSSTAMAKGGGGGKGGSGGHVHGHVHNRFHNHFHFGNRFPRNQAFLNGWSGWGDWGWGGYGDSGNGNNTVVVFPQAKPRAADVTGSTSGPCHFSADTFNVPSEGGGTRAVQVVACR